MSEDKDFGFYGEENDESEARTIKGITDKVTNYSYTNLSYPCILLKDGFVCPKHKLKVVSNMVKTSSKDKDISLYFQEKGETYKMGMLSGLQVDSFIEIMGLDNLIGFYEDGRRLNGDLIYTLCNF